MQLNIEEKKEKKNVHVYTRCFVLFLVRSLKNILVGVHDLPDTDEVVSVTSKQVLTISGPGKGDDLGGLGVGGGEDKVGLKLINESSLLEIVDLDARGSGSAEPVSVRREGQGVDLITRGQRVEVLEVVKVPKDDVTILATGGTKRSIRRNGDGRNVTSVANVVSNELGVLDVPDLVEKKVKLVIFQMKSFEKKASNTNTIFFQIKISGTKVLIVSWVFPPSEVANIVKHHLRMIQKKKKQWVL